MIVETLIIALYVVCARKGVNNLLNHTTPVAGTSGSTNQVWGLPVTRLDLRSTQEVLLIITGLLHIYHVTPPCQICPVPTGASKAGAHSWILTTYACQNLSGMHARENIHMIMHACNISTHMQFLLKLSKPSFKYF